MAGLLELLDDAPANPAPPQQGAFSQGLRAGVPGAKASFNQFAGAAAEALGDTGVAEQLGMRDGLNTFAKGRYDQSAIQSAESNQLAQGLPTWEDVKAAPSLRGAADFAMGSLGRSIPAMAPSIVGQAGAAIATRGKSLMAPALTGLAGSMPFAAGDQIGELRADPQGQMMSPGERLGVGLGSGAVQGALDQVVPLAVGAKVIGKTASQAAGKGLAALTGRGLRDVALEGVTEGAQDAVAQGTTMAVNPDKQFDYGRLEANVAGGVAAGVPMAAPGVAGELVHGNVQSAVDGVKGLAGKAGDAISGAVGAAKTAVEGAGAKIDPDGSKAASVKSTVDDIPNQLRELVKTAKDEGGDFIDRVANSEEFMNAKAFVGATGERLKSLIDQDNAQRFETVKGWAQEMADKTLSPEQQDTLRQAMTDLTDRGNQAKVAAMKKASEAFETAKAHVEKFAKDVGAHPAMRALADGPKKSADYSGIRRAIMEDVAPILTESRPEIFDDPKLVNQLGEGLRKFITETRRGKPITSDTLASLIDVAGDKTVQVLEATHRAIGGHDAAAEENFYRTLNEVRAYQETQGTTVETMRKSLTKDHANVSDGVLRKAAEVLDKWSGAKSDGAALGPAKSAYLDAKVKAELTQLFGDKADAVLAAVEKGRVQQQSAIDAMRTKVDDEGNVIDHEGHDLTETDAPKTEMQYYGGGHKHAELMLSAEHDPGKSGFEPAATAAMKRANKFNTGGTNRFVMASEIGFDHPAVKEKLSTLEKQAMAAGLSMDQAKAYAKQEIDKYGMVGSEKSASPTALSFDELDKMKLDADRTTSPSAIATGVRGVTLDAVKIVKQTNAKYTEDGYGGSITSATGQLRVARMFMEGVAAAQDHLGTAFDIPDSTVLAKRDGKLLTWGEVKNLDVRTKTDKADDADTAELTKLRKEYIEATKAHEKSSKQQRAKAQDKVREKARDTDARQDFAKTRSALDGEDDNVQRDDVWV